MAVPEPRPWYRVARPHPIAAPGTPRLLGVVEDAETGQPLTGARILAEGRVLAVAEEGRFQLPFARDGGTVRVKALNYRAAEVLVPAGEDREVTVRLEPFTPRGVYLTFYGIGDRAIRTRTLELLERTALNTLIIDVKGDRGFISYKSEVPLAQAIGATRITTFRDVDVLLPALRAQGIYTIARIVTFKDPVLAAAHPEWAVRDERTGEPWLDNEGLAWVDPFRPEVWAYVTAIAREAAEKGFDEIQFDYVRFPTDGRIEHAVYSRLPDSPERVEAINGFLAEAAAAVKPLGAFVAADVFGYTLWRTDDTGIGQRIEDMARHVDVLSPMVYPSSYHLGIPGYRFSVAYPYEIVYRSLARGRERLRGHPVRIRPWLQDFRDYAFDRRRYTSRDVLAQTRASEEAVGVDGWMLWNPRSRYTADALLARRTENGAVPAAEAGGVVPAAETTGMVPAAEAAQVAPAAEAGEAAPLTEAADPAPPDAALPWLEE
ncbi:MAG TPA: putative glycoside hydrolase [Candidatus Methylomirabilis sp.]|nr:putative glycoside hydrolase [Candidatus Methylomirabilis sp.]